MPLKRLEGLQVIGSTAVAPGLSLVTAAATSAMDLSHLRTALREVCADAALAELRATLFIDGFEPVTASDWRAVEAVEDVRQSASQLVWAG